MINWKLSKRRVLEVIRHSRNGSSVQIIAPSRDESSYEMFQDILPINQVNVCPFDSATEFEGNTANQVSETLIRPCIRNMLA